MQALRGASSLRGTLSYWAAAVATIAYTLVVTPIVVRALRPELYGVWSFINSLLAYTTLLYLGLGASLVRFGTEHRLRGDLEGFNRLFSVVLSVYSLLGILSLAAGALLGVSLGRLLSTPLDSEVQSAALLACLLLGARIGLLIVSSAFSGVLWAHERPDLVYAVPLSATLLRTVAVPLALRVGQPLVSLAVVFAVSTLLEFAAFCWLALRVQPALHWRLTWPSWVELKRLYGFGLQSFVVQMAVMVIGYTDSLVIGVTLGATAVGLYSLPLQLVEYGRIPTRGFLDVSTPTLTRLYVMGQQAELRRSFVTLARVVGCFAALVNVNIAFLGPPFLELWVGREFAVASRTVLLLLSAAALIQTVSTYVFLSLGYAVGNLRQPALVLVFEALVNLALSVALVRTLGLEGVALGTLIACAAVSMTVLPRRMARKLGVSLSEILREVVVPTCVVLVAVAAFHLASASVGWEATGYVSLIGRGLASSLFGLVVGGFAFPQHERSRVLSWLRAGVLAGMGRIRPVP